MAIETNELARFELQVLPHLDAAFNLARWLVGNDSDAQDITQEACLRSLKYFDSFHGTDARGWLLTIVRNTSYTWLRQYRVEEPTVSIEEEFLDLTQSAHEALGESAGYGVAANPETYLLQQADANLLRQAITQLPVEFREAMVLREIEELSYKQIAAITGVPVGTVMSRLARARKRLQQMFSPNVPASARKDAPHEL